MGEVYRALDTKLGRSVAIKVLPDAVRSNPERVARFEREARMLAASHPIAKGQATAIQINDVDIDHRGLVYASDRVGTGLFILEYTGRRPRQAGSR